VAVGAFLAGQIPFTGIAEVVSETLERAPGWSPRTVNDVLEIDAESRRIAQQCVRERTLVRA
jgi:1-deoxy-D-xylulose-5-phosphate reductoisomerase